MKSYRTIFAAPALSVFMLIGMMVERSSGVSQTSAAPYHARAKLAVESIPTSVGSWSARNEPMPREAMAILRPNVLRCLKYSDSDTTNPRYYDRWASLLVDQCFEARDMSGHYPPNCYVNSGEQLIYQAPRDWHVGDLTITGTEYHFRQTTATESTRTAVYNFLIVPDRGILRDMHEVDKAAQDYRRRFFGAAQFQLVMDADLSQPERDEIFKTLMEPCVPVIKTLMSGGIE